ncbi:response regulator [Pseudoxanthomonas wuyuanensis]|uniref:Two component transcriptional regulator, LuxR family n=1 Tax=Pseudoxanthomonas wuyuanensis TaxID=1073196 RepID=A0A286CYT7_9GAMM|nr:response regulator transcription factor [Pseudoxanthomonas wuyuanensis]SOD51565.1 two component transcriptional regulator, LuxR family [Pseudoxanthomonas wuyuanensis]
MRILIADDHPIIAIALTEMLKTAFPGDVHIEAIVDGPGLLHKVGQARYDYLVLDLQMPGSPTSIPLLRAVMSICPDLRVIVYTGHVHPCLALASLDLGASGYVSKNSGPFLAMEAMRAVVAGGQFVDPTIDLQAARNHPWMRLTAAEQGILIALAQGNNLQALAIDSERSYKTVTTHKYNALRKLGLRANTEIGPYLANHGLDYLLTEST